MSDRTKEHRQESAAPTMLLIDGAEADARKFEQHLRQVALNWQVTPVKDGFIAVQRMVMSGFPTVLVTCLTTARFDAVDIAGWVRSMKIERPLPILIYDELPSAEVRRQLNKLGVTDFIDKRQAAKDVQARLAQFMEQVERTLCGSC
jgi:CheY-like chemotaxis protein